MSSRKKVPGQEGERPGSSKQERQQKLAPSKAKPIDQHGQNLRQNTRNQGYQQDR